MAVVVEVEHEQGTGIVAELDLVDRMEAQLTRVDLHVSADVARTLVAAAVEPVEVAVVAVLRSIDDFVSAVGTEPVTGQIAPVVLAVLVPVVALLTRVDDSIPTHGRLPGLPALVGAGVGLPALVGARGLARLAAVGAGGGAVFAA